MYETLEPPNFLGQIQVEFPEILHILDSFVCCAARPSRDIKKSACWERTKVKQHKSNPFWREGVCIDREGWICVKIPKT